MSGNLGRKITSPKIINWTVPVRSGKTFLKEIGSTKFDWTVTDLLEFYQLNEKVVSPQICYDIGRQTELFRLELEIVQLDPQVFNYVVFLEKQKGHADKVRCFIQQGSLSESTTFKIKANERKQILASVNKAEEGNSEGIPPQELKFEFELCFLGVGLETQS